MAVCPFCLPWPRTSVTVRPEIAQALECVADLFDLIGTDNRLNQLHLILQIAW